MHTILSVNAKGGSGKSTLATNLACYYADWGTNVCLVDYDLQASSLDWLKVRATDKPPIVGMAAWEGEIAIPPGFDYAILDLPSGMHGEILNKLLGQADSMIIPVLPSPIDIRAAVRFILTLSKNERFLSGKIKTGVVANRVKEHTIIYRTLEAFLTKHLRIPLVTHLRDTQNYIHAAEQGLGIFELPRSAVEKDLEQWQPLLDWLNKPGSEASQGQA